jgi:hypothetical protein
MDCKEEERHGGGKSKRLGCESCLVTDCDLEQFTSLF